MSARIIAEPGLNPLELALGDVGAPEEVRPVRPHSVTTDEEVDVADVVRLEDDDHRRRRGVEAVPDLPSVVGRRERIEQRDLAAGGETRRGHERTPFEPGSPIRVLDPPQPGTGRHVAELPAHARDSDERIAIPLGRQRA